jgi:cytochrome c
MSDRRRIPLLAVILAWSFTCVHAQSPQLGEPVDDRELAMIDFTIMPDGRGLPEGGGNASQGAQLYVLHCSACHGVTGVEGPNDRLAGGHGTLTTKTPVKTVGSYWPHATTVFDFIRRAMPYNAPGTLSNDEIYALTAYLLFANDIVGEAQWMDRQSLPAVKMPNRDNFLWAVPQ